MAIGSPEQGPRCFSMMLPAGAPQAFATFSNAEAARRARVIREANIRAA